MLRLYKVLSGGGVIAAYENVAEVSAEASTTWKRHPNHLQRRTVAESSTGNWQLAAGNWHCKMAVSVKGHGEALTCIDS